MNIKKDFSLKNYNTFRTDAYANYFVECETIDELKQVLKKSEFKEKSRLVIGGGSNLLFTSDYQGVVIYPNIKGIEKIKENDSRVYIKAFCGENWDQFVEFCVDRNYGGVENLSLIPGKVGAVPIQNIGAYGVEAKDSIVRIEALEIKSGRIKRFTKEECKFGYRDSIFKNVYKNKYIIIAVIFELSKNPELVTDYGTITKELSKYKQKNLKTIREIIIKIRKSKLPDPEEIGNAGSFFKNPVVNRKKFLEIKDNYPDMPFYTLSDNSIKIPAGWMIEECGWKGKHEGAVGVYEKQALILVNFGDASGKEIYELSQKIKSDVYNRFSILLEEEVEIIEN